MKAILAIFGAMFLLVFGAVLMVGDSSGGATASTISPSAGCHDDGDDDEAPNEEPVDDPDSEDNEEEEDTDGRNDEPADPEDKDPSYEEDDENECDLGPTGVLGDTGTPSPTPCPTFNYDNRGPINEDCCPEVVGNGDEGCCPDQYEFDAAGFVCVCPDSAGGEVEGESGYTCYCNFGEGYECLCDLGLIPDCCQDFGYYCGGSSEDAIAADADCDGSVTPLDAYETLAFLSGVQASVGSGCGGGSSGDADCSEAVDALDTLAILAVVAGLEEAATC